MHYMEDYLQEKFVFTQMVITPNRLKMLEVKEEAGKDGKFLFLFGSYLA